MNGLILLNKAPGITSQKAINLLKRQLNLSKDDKVGHTGTLDPFASGLMLCLLGKATKLSRFFNCSKTYEAVMLFGVKTDTLDNTGLVIDRCDEPVSLSDIEAAILKIISTTSQEIPAYSAKKISGQKFYDLARNKKEVPLMYKDIEISSLHLTSPLVDNQISFETTVSQGTFIRQIASDIGSLCNNMAILTSLKRTKIDTMSLNDAYSLDQISPNSLISIDNLLDEYPHIMLDDYLIKLVKDGMPLDERQTTIDSPFWVVDKDNKKQAFYEPLKDEFGKIFYKVVVIL
jgi:tRNA pseudouridine55 synthase